MFGFPPILDGNAGIKFTNNADSGFPKPGIREIFYSNRNGNWTDVGIWETASGRIGRTPGANDDVYIRHTIFLGGNATLNNLIITPTGTLNGSSAGTCVPIVVNGSLLSYGTLNYAPGSNNLCDGAIELRGINNYIDKTKQTATYIQYARAGDQPIIDANYTVLAIVGLGGAFGEKYLTCDLVIGSYAGDNKGQASWLNFKNFNFTCNGIFSNSTGPTTIYSEGNQYLLFKGVATFGGGFYCQNAPTIEFQNNTGFGTGFNPARWNTPYGLVNSYLGTGTIKFTTNNLSVGTSFSFLTLDNTIEIADNITVTVLYTTSASLTLTNTINGLGPNSRLTNGASSTLNFGTATAATTAMSTGQVDFTTNANTIGYTGNYSATIPSYFTTFSSLLISGTGTKTLGVNTTVNSTLTISAGGTFDLGAFNIDVIGQTTVVGNFNKTGAGNVLFRGLLLLQNSASPKLNFSGGNPTVELRGGLQYGNGADPLNSGTGQWSFTTANQEIRHISGLGPTITFNCPILIASGITLTVTSTTPFASIAQFNNLVNGADASSRLVSSNNTIYITNASFPQPMTTGTFDITTNSNTLGYVFNGNYTLPYNAFSGLIIAGTGTKTLSGNTTIGGLFISTSTLEASTFNLTVTGGVQSSGTGTLSKNAGGNIIITGLLNSNINLTGNPSVELRGGWQFLNHTINTGTGTFSFTTANQTLSNPTGLAYTPTFNCNILVSGITLTYTSTIAQTLILTGVLNGSSGGSTFRMGTGTVTLNYQNTTQPMATGILDTSTNLNTFIYGAGNQQVKGNPGVGLFQQYRNLTLNGGGNKTLQGNINVQNTYTVTAPAALVLNGFIKTP